MAGRAMFGGAGGDAGEGYAYVGSRVSLGSLLDEEITTLLAEHRQDGLMQLLQARRGAPFTSTAPAWPCDASMRTRPPHACCHATNVHPVLRWWRSASCVNKVGAQGGWCGADCTSARVNK